MSIDEAVGGLLGGGAPSAKFPVIGTKVVGSVVSAEVSDQRDLDGNTRVWGDGNARKQIVVTLQTEEIDPEISDDDGTRRLFVKGQMLAAVRGALKSAGVTNFGVGGTLAVQYKEDGKAEKIGFNPPKIYVAQYKPPVAGSGVTAGVADLI